MIRSAESSDLFSMERVASASFVPEIEHDPGALLLRMLISRPSDAALVLLVAEEIEGSMTVAARADPTSGNIHRLAPATCTGILVGRVPARSKGPRTGYVDLVAVHPEFRAHGRGAALLKEAESCFFGLGATRSVLGSVGPCYAWPGIDTEASAMLALARAAGYERCGEARNLDVDLLEADLTTARDEERLRACGIEVRRAAGPSEEALIDFARSFGGTWDDEVRFALASTPARCHVAVRGAEVVGFAAHGTNRTRWFGPMGTSAEERGKGIGTVLLRRCLSDLRAAGCSSAEISWVGPVEFYSRAVGARAGRRFARFERQLA
jgi:mycothiol synthase